MLWNLKFVIAGVAAASIFAAGSAWFAHSKGKASGMLQIQTLWDAERAATQAAQAEEAMKARQKEQALQALKDQLERKHRREVDRLVREHAALVDSLRNRADRPSEPGVPQDPDAGTEPARGCTGAELYRQDGEFLAREAHRADQLRVALQACQAAYDHARREVNGEQLSP